MEFERRKQLLTDAFHETYQGEPTLWTRAPGRVDLMGSHTDYNQGFVLTMTIDRDTWIAGRPRTDDLVSLQSLNVDGSESFHLAPINHSQSVPWTNYIRGVAWVLQQADYHLTGFDALIHSTIPFGSGLSSSAAIEMASAVMFQQAGDFRLDPVEMALLGQRAENEFVGVPCGILDQYSSACGRAGSVLLLDCRENTSGISPIAEGIRFVICDTKVERNLAGTEYEERRRQCEEGVHVLRQYEPAIRALRDVPIELVNQHRSEMSDTVYRRCQFIIEENLRVHELAEALSSGDTPKLGRLCVESYAGARDLYEIGAPAMQSMMDSMLGAPGVIGARQAGAGFGGCMIALVHEDQVHAFGHHVADDYQRRTGITPSVFAVVASDGAGPLRF